MSTVVIVGAGHAGAHTAISLREAGVTGSITLIGDEPSLPYNRPPLSKHYLKHGGPAEALAIRPADFWRDQKIELRLGHRAVAIHRDDRTVELDDETRIDYEKLVLATGSRPKTLEMGRGLHLLRTWSDALAIRGHLTSQSRIVLVGAGFLGLELAAAARSLGAEVTVIEASASILGRAVSATTGSYLQSVHEEHGVRFVMAQVPELFTGTSIVLNSGEELSADVFVVGVGVVPNVDLAAWAGLSVSDGIEVDEYLRTSDSNIFAVGDCARFPCTVTGRSIRLESVQNGTEQARHVANLLGGRLNAPYRAVPHFWTEQFSRKLTIAGVASPTDRSVIRGDLGSDRFSVWRYGDHGEVTAVESVNAPHDFVEARKLLAATSC